MSHLAKVDEMFDAWWERIVEQEGEPSEQSGVSPQMAARAAFHAALCGKFGAEERGVVLIAAERQRQIEQEGWDSEHDENHTDQSLVLAAVCYATPAKLRGRKTIREQDDVSGGRGECPVWATVPRRVPKFWPENWWSGWWKPTRYDRVRELVKAGALVAAEIDRLIRVEKPVKKK